MNPQAIWAFLQQILGQTATAPNPLGMTGGSAGSGLLGMLGPNPMQTILGLITALSNAGYGTEELNQLANIFAQQQRATNIGMNPVALANRAARATLPINRELAYQVTNAADQATAGRGMGQSAGAIASGEAAALAPYAQQNLQLGADFATRGLNMPFQLQNPDYLSILGQLQNLGRGGGGATFGLPTP